MANLLIGYQDIPRRGDLTVSPAALTGFSADNVSLGARRRIWISGSAGTSHTLTYDLGASVTASSNFFYVAMAKWAAASAVATTITLAHSPDNSTYTTAATYAPITSANLLGPRLEDALTTFTATVARRYWRVTFSAGSNITPRAAKVFFGTALDMIRDPVYGRRIDVVSEHNGVRTRRYRYAFEWQGVNDSTKDSFVSNIVNWADVATVVLYSSTYHEVLKNDRAVNCKLDSWQIAQRTGNTWDISAEFEEVI